MRHLRDPLSVVVATLSFFLLLLPSAVSAEILVLRDGSIVQTEGPWQLDGRRILYTNHHGIKTMVRTSEVDLNATSARNHAIQTSRRYQPESTRRPADVVAASKRTDKTPADIILMKGGTVDIGALAAALGIESPGRPPDRETGVRLIRLRNRYLERVLTVTAPYDLERPSKYRHAGPDLRVIAEDARRMSTAAADPYLKAGLRSIADGIALAASYAESDRQAFAAVLIEPLQQRG